MKASHPKAPPTEVIWSFDVISPFSYIALGEIEQLAQRIDLVYRPILFAALLEHWRHLGPAEIPPKRLHTYRLCVFEAQRRGIPFRFPAHHPFNPLKPLRLLVALDATPSVVRTVMDCIWRDGLDMSTDANWRITCAALGLDAAAATALVEASETKARLRANTEAAVKAGLFGVPTLQIGNELFWGADALPMARAYLDNPDMFESEEMRGLASLTASSMRAAASRVG
ncbi:2-hydroxychromene-2-carboxylate isomerase [Bradyrhizobium sp.]|jgi:2-hydroxychromene-2-carboxylate isomerase|uniref:2-hydroxychromene-2-carboxylate isomerase n=1 Tax=Bradyrhizobium sp. TaxID=376 RepID=UPI002C1D8D76|nr:2-hydroxychromene-2-carboxylate isomerase [Bradyrhizobium sp.]HWX61994.1 2-hydroxychromene-2-carboxylate isomerase [Bradyrhizobium sp.]